MKPGNSGCFLLLYLFTVVSSFSQPFSDILTVSNTRYVPSSFGPDNPAYRQDQFQLNAGIPLFRKNDFLVLFSPSYEESHITGAFESEIHSEALPVLIRFPVAKNKWLIFASVIPKWNENGDEFLNSGNYQQGAAIMAGKLITQQLRLRGGLYYNHEFHGDYFLPLFGIEYKVTDKLGIFGIMPRNLTIQYRIRSRWATSLSYRGVHTSYHPQNNLTQEALDEYNPYFLFSESSVRAILDFTVWGYLVLSLEGGHTLFREHQLSLTGKINDATDIPYRESAFFRLGIAYRLPVVAAPWQNWK